MGQKIVQCNKPSSVALLQNEYYRKCLKQTSNINTTFYVNLNMPTSKWDDTEEQTINNFYKIGNK